MGKNVDGGYVVLLEIVDADTGKSLAVVPYADAGAACRWLEAGGFARERDGDDGAPSYRYGRLGAFVETLREIS